MLLTTIQLILFSRSRATYPEGLTIGQVPIGNLTREQAAERLLEAYSLPVQLVYNEQVIHLDPAVVSFELNMESMLAAADLTRTGGPFWAEFWQYLMGNQRAPSAVPLDSSYSESQLRTYLQTEIAPRYDEPPTPAQPIPGTVNFSPGSTGSTVDVDGSVVMIERALASPNQRFITLPTDRTASARPSFANLEILLKQTIDITGFDGIAGVYLLDLRTADEMHFIYENGEDLATDPDFSFTASSIIKIPILVAAYQRLPEPTPADAEIFIAGMIEESGNDPADWLMEGFIDPNRGPIQVTDNMRDLGLENTFLAGFFRFGSPLLAFYDTPANSRADAIPDNDPYNQTTVSDMGMLLADIYQCAQTGGGTLVAVYPGQITQGECQDMIGYLSRNNTPFLIEAGAPEGTQIAHKHGWVTDLTGAITTIGDAGLVFTPSGDYALVIFFYHPVQLVWEPISALIADLSSAIYNYYNLPSP
jgi:beta-lactamase class A